jgi:CDP-paratose 2-epimerase
MSPARGQRVIVTGGAGFIGSHVALRWKGRHPDVEVVAFDNLMRRGSELNLERLARGGVRFVHGDVRSMTDLEATGGADLLVDCSAEPSVQSGAGDDAPRLVGVNLLGTLNCLELARLHRSGFILLSTSRVYPIDALRELPLERDGDRLALPEDASGPGWSRRGVSRAFPLEGRRSLYGATKLAAELIVEEYAASHGVAAVVDRCGVVSGPWQMGRVDQGFVALWAAGHCFGGRLGYRGFEGAGLQVRDVLHVEDLCDLLELQMENPAKHAGRSFLVGGGPERSVSLRELSALCRELTGRDLEIGSDPTTHANDVPWFVTDVRDVHGELGWRPRRSLRDTVSDVVTWIQEQRDALRPLFAPDVPRAGAS